MTDYQWNVWLSNRSDQSMTVEVSQPLPTGSGRGVQALRLPPHSTMSANGGGKGTDTIVDVYSPACHLVISLPVEHSLAFAVIDPDGTARRADGLTQSPSDAPEPANAGEMQTVAGCSDAWKAWNRDFRAPASTPGAASS